MILEWSHPGGFAGIYICEYKGHQLRIEPVGSAEWDGLIDGKVIYGTDDLEAVEEVLVRTIDSDFTYSPYDAKIIQVQC